MKKFLWSENEWISTRKRKAFKFLISLQKKKLKSFSFIASFLRELSALSAFEMSKKCTHRLFTPHDKHSHHQLPSFLAPFSELMHSAWEMKYNNCKNIHFPSSALFFHLSLSFYNCRVRETFLVKILISCHCVCWILNFFNIYNKFN